MGAAQMLVKGEGLEAMPGKGWRAYVNIIRDEHQHPRVLGRTVAKIAGLAHVPDERRYLLDAVVGPFKVNAKPPLTPQEADALDEGVLAVVGKAKA